MEYLIGIGVILGLLFIYGYVQASKWEKEFRIGIGKYYKLPPEQASKQTRFDGTCYFDECFDYVFQARNFGGILGWANYHKIIIH